MNITQEQISRFLKDQYRTGDFIIKVILINLGVYLTYRFTQLLEWFLRLESEPISTFAANWIILPYDLTAFYLKIHTLLTYQFFHDSFLHLFINLMLIYFFGKQLLTSLGIKKLVPLYLLGGVFGGFVYLLASLLPFVQYTEPIAGASASALALMGAMAVLHPDMPLKFFFVLDVKLKWMLVAMLVLSILSIFSPANAGTGIIHLAGLSFGIAYIFLDKKGISIYKPFNQMVDYLFAFFKKKPKVKVSYVNPNFSKVSKKKSTEISQENVDAILDKISKNGYESLSKEERDYLFNASKN